MSVVLTTIKRPSLIPSLLTRDIATKPFGRGLVDSFFINTDGATSLVNHATAYCAEAANATVTGSPTFASSYGTFTAGAYLQTSATETANFTILFLARIRAAGGGLGVSWGNNYAVDTSVNAGATKFGILGNITQTGASDYTGSVNIRVGYAKPHASAPAITYAYSGLAIPDTRTWRLVAAVAKAPAASVDNGGAQILDLTNNTASTVGTVGQDYCRICNTLPYRIGVDYGNFFNGQVDIAAWMHWNRALSTADLAQIRQALKPYFAIKGIAI